MKNRKIGIIIMITLFLFGCKPNPEIPPADGEQQEEDENSTVKVTVTFNVDGGTPSYQPVSINKGSALGDQYPADPQKSGNAFGGWYDVNDASYLLKYIKTTVINDNITLKARWLPVEPEIILLTIGAKKDLSSLLGASMSGQTVTWSSSDPTKVSVDANGNITSNLTSFTAAEGGSKKYTEEPAKAQVTITAIAGGNAKTFKVTATIEAQENIMELPPLKDRFPAGILVGNIAASGDAGASSIINTKLTRHFNALTSENDMKPSSVSNGRNSATGVISYTWNNADKFVNAAAASKFEIIGHTLLWHSQIPAWQTNMATESKATALTAMKQFINDVMTRYKGKIYSWDVLNEAFPDGVSAGSDWKNVMRQENPWYKAIGSDFVYEAYLEARKADPKAKLYYNDFNTDQIGKATMIRDMVRDVNNKYKNEYPAETRLLIEGIGMQEHHNTGVSASNINAALTLFKAIGVKVSVSEIDVLGQDWSSFSSVGQGANKQNQSTVTNNGLLTQASLYQQYMQVYMKFTDIIERISFWGITDNQSWRSAGLPLLFDNNGKAKPAYYRFIGALPAN